MEKSTYFLVTLFSLALGSLRADEAARTEQTTSQNTEVAALRKQVKGLDTVSGQKNRLVILEQEMSEVYTDTVRDTFGAKAASARPQIDSYHLYFASDALFWKAFEGGTDYAYTANNLTPPFSGSSKYLDFDWRWGFRAELGYRTSHDDWNLAARYTWFYDKASSELAAPVGGQVIPLFYQFLNGPTFSFAKGHLNLHLNDADLSLQKSYFLSRAFSLTSLAGLRTTWIAQHLSEFASNEALSNTIDLSGKNHFWGIGPKLGITPKWFVGPNWNFFGSFAGSLLYGEFDVTARAFEDGVLTSKVKSDNLHQIVPTVQGTLGFGWEMNSFCNRYHIAINAAYEASYWWRQNRWFSYLPDSSATQILKRLDEDLGFHGLTINALFDF